MQTPTRFEALTMVLEHFPSQQAMADAFGVTQPTIWRWVNQSRQMPPEFVLQAESMTGVFRYWLRPDIYPIDLPPAPYWLGTDLNVGPVVFPSRETRKGNRDSVLHLTRSATR